MPETTASDLAVRTLSAADLPAVLDLVNADRVPGQPPTDAAMLAEALAGRSPVDGGWWAELAPPTTEIAHDTMGRPVGVVSYATRPRDGAGLILWLHCREDEAVADLLLRRALDALGRDRTVRAFDFASALSLGLEGLPSGHRPATRRALAAHGFAAEDLWRYMHAGLPLPGLTPLDPRFTCQASDSTDPPGRVLHVRDGSGAVVADATVGTPVSGIGVLWWIGVATHARGRGLGAGLLAAALDELSALGAREVILYVDDDAPADDPERSRAAANRMYDRAGLTEVDRLHSFTRTPHAAPER
ncbi:GNAT family N-acetyltransferase [Yinghuangia soli]|uniref:GNAT family N-acetyltransferase n=1 Tax=Yinghuangia soli TaxID=2908204 RepID=A0AA41U3A8_9ACTN|nr:GNAT family N-acetyltransferase [Yinghuangia soli]MCF2527894.1 GNAT family N-acetyltransferase [Yinghuangia soli]